MVGRWLREDVKPYKSPNTYANYEALWRRHGAPSLAGVKLEKCEVRDVDRLLSTLRKGGTSASVIQRLCTVLHRAFVVAIRRRDYHRANPFALIERPTHRPTEARALSIEEAKRFIDAAREDRYEALWLLLISAGLRLGEALALEVGDVDFKKRTVSIRRSFIEVNGRVEVGNLKTKGSRRIVDLGNIALEALERRAEVAEDEGTAPLLFATANGTPMRRSNLRRSHFARILESAELGHMRVHDLRHSMTALGIAEGIGAKILADRLGHSTTRLTQDRYGHVLPGVGRSAAEAIDSVLTRELAASPKRQGARKVVK